MENIAQSLIAEQGAWGIMAIILIILILFILKKSNKQDTMINDELKLSRAESKQREQALINEHRYVQDRLISVLEVLTDEIKEIRKNQEQIPEIFKVLQELRGK